MPEIVKTAPLKNADTYYTDADKDGKSGYSGRAQKVTQTKYTSVQKAEIFAVIMLLKDIKEASNIVTDSQCTEFTAKHVETIYSPQDKTETNQLLIELQNLTQHRHPPVYYSY